MGSCIGVDDALIVPIVEGLQDAHNILLLHSSNDLGAAVIIAHAQRIQTCTQGVIHIGLIAAAVLEHRERCIAGFFLDSSQGLGQLCQIGDAQFLGIVVAGFLNKRLVPDDVLALRRILVGRHAVDLAADLAGLPVIFGNGCIQFRGNFLHHIGDIQERTNIDIVVINIRIGEQDIVLAAGVHDNIAAGIPVAPGDDLHIDVDTDFFLQIGVDLCKPCIVVGRHAAADCHPLQGDDFVRRCGCRSGVVTGAGGGRGRGTAAAGCEAQSHGTCHAQSNCFVELFHLFFLLFM